MKALVYSNFGNVSTRRIMTERVKHPAVNINFPSRCSFVYIRTCMISIAVAFCFFTALLKIKLVAGVPVVGFTVSAATLLVLMPVVTVLVVAIVVR